jgi:hypothetical protein
LTTPEGVAVAEAAILALVAGNDLPEPIGMAPHGQQGYLSIELPDAAALTLWCAAADVRVHPADPDVHGAVFNAAWAFIDDGVHNDDDPRHRDGLHIELWYDASPWTAIRCMRCEGAGWQVMYCNDGGVGIPVVEVTA